MRTKDAKTGQTKSDLVIMSSLYQPHCKCASTTKNCFVPQSVISQTSLNWPQTQSALLTHKPAPHGAETMQGGKIIIAFWSPEHCQFYKHWNSASAFFISLMALGEAMPTVKLFILLDLLVVFIFLFCCWFWGKWTLNKSVQSNA